MRNLPEPTAVGTDYGRFLPWSDEIPGDLRLPKKKRNDRITAAIRAGRLRFLLWKNRFPCRTMAGAEIRRINERLLRNNTGILENLVEALIGAVALDTACDSDGNFDINNMNYPIIYFESDEALVSLL